MNLHDLIREKPALDLDRLFAELNLPRWNHVDAAAVINLPEAVQREVFEAQRRNTLWAAPRAARFNEYYGDPLLADRQIPRNEDINLVFGAIAQFVDRMTAAHIPLDTAAYTVSRDEYRELQRYVQPVMRDGPLRVYGVRVVPAD